MSGQIDAVHAAFDSLKSDFRDGRFPVIAGRVTGEAVAWGGILLEAYRGADRAALDRLDPLTRFWVVRYRGMPEPADLTGAPPGAAFVLAFTAFPYLDVMMECWELGAAIEPAETERVSLRCLFDGTDDGVHLVAERIGGGWRFDLMPLYLEKARAFERFITDRFGGDFDQFLEHYVGEHDLPFNTEQAWRPLAAA